MNWERENQKQLSDFFTDEYQALKGYVNSRIDSTVESEAEDIIQDVALKLFSRFDPSPIDNIAGFVYRSVKNRIIDVMRTKKKRISEENHVENLWTEFAELFYGNTVEYSENLKNKLKHHIRRLKPMYRDIIIAVDFEGYTYREIAEQTGISPGTLMSRRHRAVSLLVKHLETEKLK
ncbi:RNA polymerase sigma factor [Allomuricauda sp. d1]|uniref:RNA polymerase sigma factor n=1 Tax=Allomuricauda sp. d1 TaxID=3136725 RepID=UPI0031E2D0BF